MTDHHYAPPKLGIILGGKDAPVRSSNGQVTQSARLSAGDHRYEAVARLKPGISEAQAQAETAMLLRGERSPEEIGARLVSRDYVEDAGLQSPLYLLLAASFVLLLLACGNVALRSA